MRPYRNVGPHPFTTPGPSPAAFGVFFTICRGPLPTPAFVAGSR